MVTSVDWLTYPVLHMDSVPAVDRDRPDRPPRGGAFRRRRNGARPGAGRHRQRGFDATGVRLRRVPFTPERVKAALEKA